MDKSKTQSFISSALVIKDSMDVYMFQYDSSYYDGKVPTCIDISTLKNEGWLLNSVNFDGHIELRKNSSGGYDYIAYISNDEYSITGGNLSDSNLTVDVKYNKATSC